MGAHLYIPVEMPIQILVGFFDRIPILYYQLKSALASYMSSLPNSSPVRVPSRPLPITYGPLTPLPRRAEDGQFLISLKKI
jgi:hypothetical protein